MDCRFQSIEDTHRSTGLPVCFLRKGVREKTIPFIMTGKKYLINVPMLMELLDQESRRGAQNNGQ